MQAIRQIKKPHGNKVTVDIPTNFKTNMVEVIILPIETESSRTRNLEKEIFIGLPGCIKNKRAEKKKQKKH